MGQIEPFPASASRRPQRLMERVRSELRVRHYSIRTEEAYTAWIRRYLQFHRRHPRELDGDDLNRYLTHLAEDRRVAVSTQRQALAAILFSTATSSSWISSGSTTWSAPGSRVACQRC